MSLFGDMNRPDINNFFLSRVVDALIGKNQNTGDNEQNPEPTGSFHFLRTFLDGPARKTAVAKAAKTKVDVDCHRLISRFLRLGVEDLKAA